ncbi:MAG TPA: tetratricopeptide repeat protein [Kofleriaceae bacterium]
MKHLLVLALAASTAQAQTTVWDRAIDIGKSDRAIDDKYDAEMEQGDDHARLASSKNASIKEIMSQLQLALASYRAASALKPRDGEPYFRIGKLLYSFYFDCSEQWSHQYAFITCDATRFKRDKAKEVIAAWDAFEARAPLDPRLSVEVMGDSEILFDRAILHTKLASKQDLEAAAADYEKLLARHDGESGTTSRVLGNLAETYMMLDRLEEALETYREALRGSSDTSTWYGYAVALDRDESTRQALEIIRSLGREQRDSFYMGVAGGGTFFVPEGEKYYYFALSDEAFGFEQEAMDNWSKYIASGAHPEFQPRAKAHLDALSAHKKRKAIPIETPWPELFR